MLLFIFLIIFQIIALVYLYFQIFGLFDYKVVKKSGFYEFIYILGLLGLIICNIITFIAWVMAISDLNCRVGCAGGWGLVIAVFYFFPILFLSWIFCSIGSDVNKKIY